MDRIDPFDDKEKQPNPERLITLRDLGYDALLEVTSRYGTGHPETDRLIKPEVKSLPYHNMEHTMRVRDVARRVAQHHGLNEYDIELAVLAASAHDVIHESEAEKSAEERSAQWVLNKMFQNGLPHEDQEIVHLSILGTKPITDTDGNLISQEFTLTTFPSERAGEIALCVAVADLEALFAADQPLVAHDLFREQQGLSSDEIPSDLSKLIHFQKQQLALLEDYQPLYPNLELFLGNNRRQSLQHHAEILRGLEQGSITNWQQVIDMDLELFRRSRIND